MRKRSDKGFLFGLPLNKYVTLSSLFLVFSAIAFSFIAGKNGTILFKTIQDWISTQTGWIYILIVNAILFFCIYISFSKYGKIKLGGKKAEPEFSTKAWLAMLFSAGMGIGLIFFGVAEPIMHFHDNPLTIGASDAKSAQIALTYTFLHWGIHGWAIFALVGASLAYFTYNKKQPLALRSAFYPLFGNGIHHAFGNIIDIVALVATLFGIATSLGYGVIQFTSGLNILYGVDNGISTKISCIAIITLIATMSVYSGIHKGVKLLSSWNMRMASLLLLVVIVFGPTTYIFRSFVQSTGNLVGNLIEISFWNESYWGIQEDALWQNSWTIYYWSWWCAWSPFVGMFIARISKGRTLKEFFLSVITLPSLFTFFWMSTFGGSALFYEMMGDHSVSIATNENMGSALFAFLNHFPFSLAISTMALVLIVSFFVTSADSGALVVDLLASGGRTKTKKIQKAFWSILIGIITISLIFNGGSGGSNNGLESLQTMVIICGLPFSLLLITMCFSLYKDLKRTLEKHTKKEKKAQKKKVKAQTINEILDILGDDTE